MCSNLPPLLTPEASQLEVLSPSPIRPQASRSASLAARPSLRAVSTAVPRSACHCAALETILSPSSSSA
jgi:hypothetical protein